MSFKKNYLKLEGKFKLESCQLASCWAFLEEFYIGGYQPAQKWLKYRHGRKLSHDDVIHYQKIIIALTETDKLMQLIDKIEIEQ